jgi:hypothetical protein
MTRACELACPQVGRQEERRLGKPPVMSGAGLAAPAKRPPGFEGSG